MANKHLPCFHIKVSVNGLQALCVALYQRIQDEATVFQASNTYSQFDDKILIWNSLALIKEWVKKMDRQNNDKPSMKIELDVMQGLAFNAMWSRENELPNYEAGVLHKIIAAIDTELNNQRYRLLK